jgi:serine protease SohB
MADFFFEYGLFLVKLLSIMFGILFVVGGIARIISKHREEVSEGGSIVLSNLSEELDDIQELFLEETLDPDEYKRYLKQKKQTEKKEKKEEKKASKKKAKQHPDEEIHPDPRLFVIQFHGDVEASDVDNLKECINAVLTTASEQDEVLVVIDSHGGYVHSYGLAASQLARLRAQSIPLTVAIDTVAASGGYLMAVVANKIIAAPFAIVGSIGVIAELPNFHRLLKKHDVDYETYTAGKYKRTVTVFGENTEQGREKFREELADVHRLFQQHIADYRKVNLEKTATGEHWHAKDAIKLGLVDEIKTSDDFMFEYYRENKGKIYRVEYIIKESFADRLQNIIHHTGKALLTALIKLTPAKLLQK